VRAQVKLPKLGDTANDVVVISWQAEVGASVSEGDPLLTVQTDKVEVDVPSPMTGTVVEQLVAPDDEVAVGDPVAVLEF
jgi:pyruvate/2-oxoglutarate dehydrogenase complex dihydrolipoamide acyltransferase (E2) component